MAYQTITQYTSPNQTPGRGGHSIEFIVIHWWNDPANNPGFHGAINTLCNPARQASAHCVAEAGRVAWIVNASNTAWHAGNWNANCRSIGIECNPRMSEGDLETIGELIADLRRTYGPLPLYPHNHFFNTQCPGTYESKLAWLDQRAAQILGGSPAGKPTINEGDEDMNADQDRKLTAIYDLLTPGRAGVKYVGDIVARLDRIEKQSAQITALTAAVTALSQARGLDGTAITQSVTESVDKALADLKITLTTESAK